MNSTAVTQEKLRKVEEALNRIRFTESKSEVRIEYERILRTEAVLDARKHRRITQLVDDFARKEVYLDPFPMWRAPSLVPGETFVLLPGRTVRIRVDDAGLDNAPMNATAKAAVQAAQRAALHEVERMCATKNPDHLTKALSFPALEPFDNSHIEGKSLGLSIAMAIFSHLYTRALPESVAATAEVTHTGWLQPVESSILDQKISSLIDCWPQVKTLVVADGQEVGAQSRALLDTHGIRLVHCRRLHERHRSRLGALEVFFPNGIQRNFIPEVHAYLSELGKTVRLHNDGYVTGSFALCQKQSFDFDVWRSNLPPVTYVSGEFGTGKTRFCLHLVAKLCESPHPTKPLLVVYVDLARVALDKSALRKVVSSREDAVQVLLDAFQFDDLSGAMTAMRKPPSCEYPMLVFLEGIDEIADDALARTLLVQSTKIANDPDIAKNMSIHFVISGRINTMRHHCASIPLDRGLSIPTQWLPSNDESTDPKMVVLRLWNDEDVRAFIDQTYPQAEALKIYDLLHGSEKLRDLCRRPLVLDLLSRAVANGGEIRRQTLLGVFDHVWEGYASKLRGVNAVCIRHALEHLAYRTWLHARKLARSRGQSNVNDAALVFSKDWLRDALLERDVAPQHVESYIIQATKAPLFRKNGRAWEHRMFLDYFIARHVARDLPKAVEESKEHLQDTFCRLGLLDLLREAVEDTDEGFLCGLLKETEETRVFASHLLRRTEFAEALPELEAAYDACETDQARIYVIFAILSHQEIPREKYVRFVIENRDTLLNTLKLFVEGEASDVCAFNLSRILKKEHRSKAILYLTSLSNPQATRTRPQSVIETVGKFVRDCNPSEIERALAHEVLELAGKIIENGDEISTTGPLPNTTSAVLWDIVPVVDIVKKSRASMGALTGSSPHRLRNHALIDGFTLHSACIDVSGHDFDYLNPYAQQSIANLIHALIIHETLYVGSEVIGPRKRFPILFESFGDALDETILIDAPSDGTTEREIEFAYEENKKSFALLSRSESYEDSLTNYVEKHFYKADQSPSDVELRKADPKLYPIFEVHQQLRLRMYNLDATKRGLIYLPSVYRQGLFERMDARLYDDVRVSFAAAYLQEIESMRREVLDYEQSQSSSRLWTKMNVDCNMPGLVQYVLNEAGKCKILRTAAQIRASREATDFRALCQEAMTGDLLQAHDIRAGFVALREAWTARITHRDRSPLSVQTIPLVSATVRPAYVFLHKVLAARRLTI